MSPSPLRIPVHLLVELTSEQVAAFAARYRVDPADRAALMEKVTATVAHQAGTVCAEPAGWAVTRRPARQDGGV